MSDSIQLYTTNDLNSLPSASFVYSLDAYGPQIQMNAMQNLGMNYDPHYSLFLAAPNVEPQKVKSKFTLRALGATDGMTLYVLLTDPSNSKPQSSVPQVPRPLPTGASPLPRLNTSQANKNPATLNKIPGIHGPTVANIPTPLILQNKGMGRGGLNILGKPNQPPGILNSALAHQNPQVLLIGQQRQQTMSQNSDYAPSSSSMFPPINANPRGYGANNNTSNDTLQGNAAGRYPYQAPQQHNQADFLYGQSNQQNAYEYSENDRANKKHNRPAYIDDDNYLPPEIEPYVFNPEDFEISSTQNSISIANDKTSGNTVVIKRINGQIQNEQFYKELINIMNAEAGGILHLEGFIPNPCSLIYDYHKYGSLDDMIDSERIMNAPREWNATAKMIALFGIAEGMRKLHSKRIMHRNLKPSNVLLDENMYPIIGDVGITREYNHNPSYMAPEMLAGGSYKSKVDIFAYGMIVYQTVCQRPPFDPAISFQQVKHNIMAGKRPDIPSDAPSNYVTLIKQCWNQEPSLRPTFAVIVDAFVNGNYVLPGADNDAVAEYQRIIAPQFEPELAKVIQIQKSAEIGDPNAQYEFAMCLMRGRGATKNVKEGIRYLQHSADKGNDRAQYAFGRYLLRFEKDEERAKHYLKKSAQSGNSNAKCLLAYIASPPKPQAPQQQQYNADPGVNPRSNSNSAAISNANSSNINQVNAAVEKPPDQPNIDSILEQAKQLEKTNPEKSFKLYQAAAEMGNVKAQLRLALAYHNGTNGVQKDIVLANKYYQLSADQGNARAQCNLAFNLQRGDGIEKNISLANDLYKKSADCGYAIAQYNYAYNLMNGVGVPKDVESANKYYRLAADLGHPGAQFSYASNLMKGNGVEKNVQLANDYFRMSANKGNALAQCQLGMNLANGSGHDKDLVEANKYYKMAADQGNSRAQCNYAFSLQKGVGVTQDLAEANRYYKLSADQNYPIAQYNLAFNLENGNGIEKNLAEANKYYKMAADLGNANAQYNFAMNLIKGAGIGKDIVQANKYLKMSVDQKNPRAQYQYALHLQKGTGTERDPKLANELLKASADQGNPSAQFYYGYNLFNGNGVTKNPEEANKYYKLAADQGNSNSQCNLACSYLNGIGMPKDIKEANRYYKMSADAGNAVAQYNYGIHLMNGNGVEKDMKGAVNYLKKSADQNNASAQYCISLCYENGNGLEKDAALAVKYLKMSADAGNKLAIQHLKK